MKILPNNLQGSFVFAHGNYISDIAKETFTIPRNTYIIYLTEMGKYGVLTDSMKYFMKLCKDSEIIEELLYLTTFDFNNEWLGNIAFLKNRTVYSPYTKIQDSIITMYNYKTIDCLDFFIN